MGGASGTGPMRTCGRPVRLLSNRGACAWPLLNLRALESPDTIDLRCAIALSERSKRAPFLAAPRPPLASRARTDRALARTPPSAALRRADLLAALGVATYKKTLFELLRGPDRNAVHLDGQFTRLPRRVRFPAGHRLETGHRLRRSQL